MKYLGVYLDGKLNFEDHSAYIHQNAVKKLGILRKAQEFLDKKTSILLYKSLVLPHFDYCNVVYSTATATCLQKLQLVQTSACRIMLLADKRTPVSQMHNDLNLMFPSQRRDFHLSCEMHKHILNNNSSLHKSFKKKRGCATTLSNGDPIIGTS